MSIACQKQYSLTVAGCPSPTVKAWANAALTGREYDLTKFGLFLIGELVVTPTNSLWVHPARNDGILDPVPFFFSAFDIGGASPVQKTDIGPVAPSTGSRCVRAIYIPANNKIMAQFNYFNGVSFEQRLYFLNTDGSVRSVLTGLTSEQGLVDFAYVDKGGVSGNLVGWYSGGNTNKLLLINTDTESLVTSAAIGPYPSPSNFYTGICYSCKTDSFFINKISNSTLNEYDRATLALKNSYPLTLAPVPDYIKTTQEIWCIDSSTAFFNIINPSTGAIVGTSASMPGGDFFSGWQAGPPNSHFYNEKLNAICCPGQPGTFFVPQGSYYIFDIATRTIKATVNCASFLQAFAGNVWVSQGFNPTTGIIYLSTGFNVAGWNSLFEIGTT